MVTDAAAAVCDDLCHVKALTTSVIIAMRPPSTLLRLAVQVIVALFAIDSIVTHFNPTVFSNHDRLAEQISIQPFSAGNNISHEGGVSPAHQPPHEQKKPSSSPDQHPDFTTTNYVSSDKQIQHYSVERPSSALPEKSVLFLTITRDENSWGRNPDEPARTIYSFLDFITNTTLSPSAASVAILTSSESEFERYKEILTPTEENISSTLYYDYPFHRITLVLYTASTRAPLPSESSAEDDTRKWTDTSSRSSRHAVAQHERRATLAKLRNYLQFVSLARESHLLWLDSDVYKFSDHRMVSHMLERCNTSSEYEVGILTARCRLGEPEKAEAWLAEHPEYKLPPASNGGEADEEMRGGEGGRYEIMAHKHRAQGQYDLNAWRGRRTGPNNIEQEMLWKDLTAWEPHPAPGGQTQILDGVIDKTGNDEIERLDSVGGTILMIRADLVRMGLTFATGYAVGMTWEHGEGWDGIETEGICLLSRSMSRDGQSMCYTLGGDWSVWHTVY